MTTVLIEATTLDHCTCKSIFCLLKGEPLRRFSEVIDARFVKIEMNFRVAAIGIDDTNQALFNVAIV